MSASIHGIIGYTITPFAADGGLDLPALGRSIERLIDGGVHAIAPLGSTGEGAYLSDPEWDEVVDFTLKTVAHRVPTIVSVSDLTTAKTVRRAQFAESLGAEAVMVLPISYWKLNEAEVFQHYRAVGEAIGVPVMLYNNPGTSGIDMSVELILRIVREVDNVTMVKESTGDIQRMHKLRLLGEGRVPFYNGCNPLALEAFVAGAKGWCSAAPNLIPTLNGQLYQAVLDGDPEKARALFYRQLPLLDFILRRGLPTTIKAGLGLSGLEVGRRAFRCRRWIPRAVGICRGCWKSCADHPVSALTRRARTTWGPSFFADAQRAQRAAQALKRCSSSSPWSTQNSASTARAPSRLAGAVGSASCTVFGSNARVPLCTGP